MVENNDVNHSNKNRPWNTSVFSVVKRCGKFLIINSLLFSLCGIMAQCPDKKIFKDKINTIYNSSGIGLAIKLNELLQLRQQMRACNLESDSSFMYLLQKIGVVYFKQSDYANAINFTNEAIHIAKKGIVNLSGDALSLVNNYSNLYYYYKATGQQEKEYDAIDSCIAYAFKGNSGYDMALSPLCDKTEYLFNTGKYSLCIRNAKLGEDIIKKYYHAGDSIQYISFFLLQQANALFFFQSIDSAEKLLEIKILQFNQTHNNNQVGPLYSLLGLINEKKQNYTKALFCFQQGYHTNSVIKYNKGCAQDLASIGTLYSKYLNKPNAGLEFCNKALKYGDSNDSSFIFQQMANIYISKGLYDKAQYFFQLSFNAVQMGMDETTMLKNSFQFPDFNLLQNLSDLTTDKGNAYVKEYYETKNKNFLIKALSIYKKNDLFLAKIKTEQQLDLASNLVWRNTARNLYEHAIGACYADNNIEDAFYFFEKSRAILLNDQINEQRWMADTDIAKQAVLKKSIIELNNKLNTTTANSDENLKIQKTLYIKNQQLDVLTNNIKNKNPLYYQNYLDTTFISLIQLRKNILNNSKSLIEIFSGDSAVYVLRIANNNQSLSKINKQLYDSLVNSFTSFIANRYVLNEHFKDFVKTAHQLYNLLFQNIKPSYGSIIISPDGVNYPFEALVMNGDVHNPGYFLNHYATSYTYSVKYLTNQFATNTSNSNSVLGVAPVKYDYHNLSELSGSDNSLKIINKYFSNATNYVLEKASKNNFLQNFPDYNIIQLYTHASDTSTNGDPVIYFSDSALYLSSLIPDRKPVTQLVVLSACETANGKLYHGEGIFSFNRGFAALGIPAAVSNLWSVDNESTYQITELFYKYLSQGLPTDIALQKAKLEFINNSSANEKKLPYFWAASILTGKVDIIKSDQAFPLIKWIIITIISLVFFYLIWKVIRSFRKSNLH